MSARPRLLDLFCGAGGAAMGYWRAGFDILGVDIRPMPDYPFQFVQADALEYVRAHGHQYDFIHASPPCQHYSKMTGCRPGLNDSHPDLVGVTRAELIMTGRPWVIENVVEAPVRPDLLLCGFMFGRALYRHRIFESPLPLRWRFHPEHSVPSSRAGHYKPGHIISVAGNCYPIALAREVMGIEWMRRDELAEAIPPDFTTYIGRQILDRL
jgi:DNA (cytosine-5)-methyltransferase 1